MKNLVCIAGQLGQELIKAFRELKTSIRSIDRDRIPEPKKVIKELKGTVRSIIEAGKEKLEELWETIQDLKSAIGSIAKEKMPDMQDVFNSIGEWWLDLRNTVHNIDFNTDWKMLKEKVRDTFRNKDALPLDKVANIIAGLGIPGLVLVALMVASPWYGAAAMTSALAVLGGPLGMVGGITTLLMLTLIAKAIAKFGCERVFKAVLLRLKESGYTCQEILEKIDAYPISKELKRKLIEFIQEYSTVGNEECNDE